jgi:sec-independent protein translocase protein TatA
LLTYFLIKDHERDVRFKGLIIEEDLTMDVLSIWHWLIVIAVVLLLFGRGKVSELMGDVAQGIKAFKKGLAADELADHESNAHLSHRTEPAATQTERRAGT